IARGGMGVVYKARQVSLNRIVALKMILAGQLASAADVQRFRTEAEAAANLDHPNIVPIYEIGEHQGQHYFSMKLIEGGSLGEQVARFSQDPTDAAQLLMTVARAVHHAHQRGILHRDLKPGNILVDGQGQPHVTDFGLAKRVQGDSRLTQSGAIVGTPSYMAPEQARSEKVLTTAVDIYSLGAILYELLTGRPPFKAGTPLDTVLQVLEREPERPRVLNPRTDHDLETICLKCLEKEPHNRYGSAEAVAEDLERWLASEPIHARRTAAWERGLKWMQRRPAIAALTSLLAVSGVLGAGGVIWQWREAEAARQEALAKASAEEQAKTEAQQAQEAEERQRQQAQAALARAERSLYFQRIALAERYWLANNLGRAEEYLDACPLALRHWEWHYLKHLCHAEAVSLRGYPNYEAAYTPDGRLLATTGPDNTILLLDRATWQVARVLRGHQRPVEKLALSGDGRTLASVSQDGMIKLWSVESAQELRTWTARSVVDLAIDRDGRRVAAATQRTAPYGGAELILHRPGEVILWDGEGQQLLRIPGAGTNVALSPDGKQIVSFSENVLVPGGAVRIWDATTGELVSTLRQLHYPQARTAFSQDGRWLVAVDDKTAVLWDAATSKQLRSLTGHTSQINHVAFSHDGRRLATADREGMIKLWNPDRGEELFTYRAHKGPVGSVALSPDGQQLASTGADGTLRIWDATQGQQVRR
ncbi:MAG TPA: serine/threonine-protein kinase, partial [Gemmataceae bacterium]|nr:serine/threonine-protein kinase [Gemmataceae bacterium]